MKFNGRGIVGVVTFPLLTNDFKAMKKISLASQIHQAPRMKRNETHLFPQF